MFKLVSKYKPSGDQPKAIKELVEGIKDNAIIDFSIDKETKKQRKV